MRTLKNAILVSFVAMLIGGCAVGPDFIAPNPDLPAQWKTAEQNSSAAALNRWWEKLDDPALNTLVNKALEQNKEIAIAAARNESFMAQLGVVESNLLPQFEAGASMSRQELSATTSNRTSSFNKQTSTYGLNIAMSRFEIDFWGKYARAEESAKAALLSSEYNRQMVRSSIVANVVSAYNALLTQHRLLDNADKNRILAVQIASITQVKWDQGVGSYSDVLHAGASADEARGAIAPIESKISTLENILSLLAGEYPKHFPISKDDISFKTIDVPAGLPSNLLKRRPDILAAEASWHSVNASIGVAKAAYFPSFSLTAMLGLQSAELSNLLKSPSRVWQIAPSVTMPIFTAGRTKSEVDFAQAQTKESQAYYEQTLLKAFGDVDNALKARQTLQEEANALNSAYKKYLQAHRVSTIEYESGKTGYLPLLITKQSLIANENRIVLNEEAKKENFITLCKALGGGWE